MGTFNYTKDLSPAYKLLNDALKNNTSWFNILYPRTNTSIENKDNYYNSQVTKKKRRIVRETVDREIKKPRTV